MGRLTGHVAIVTGASSGIGQSIAKRLAEEGAGVVVNYSSNVAGGDETRRMIEAAGAKAALVQADVSKLEDVGKMMQAASSLGDPDILVNNAGIEKEADFVDGTEADYDRVMAVNLKSVYFMTQAFVRRLKETGKPGRVINISSVHEDMAFPGFTSYCASKGGVRMLTRNLAVELGPLGITINNVAPGAIATPINKSLLADKPKLDALLAKIPLGRLGTTEEVAGLVAYLASDEAAYITGSTFEIDGGLSRYYREQ